MKEKKSISLRKKAEEVLDKMKLKTSGQFSEEEVKKLIHLLQAHQIELESQNEDLQIAKAAEKKAFEKKYQNLYDYAPTGYFTLSAEGIIVELNLAGATLIGKERSHIKTKQFSLFISEESKLIFSQFFENVLKSDKTHACDVTLVSRDESMRYVHLSGIATEDKKQFLLTAVDMTERKHAELELINSEKKFKNVFNSSVIGKSITYMDGSLAVNEAFSSIVGYSEKELKKMKWTDLTHPDDLERDQKIIESIVSGKAKNSRWEKRYIQKNGNIVWVDISTTLQYDEKGNPQFFITSIADITEQKLAENNLKEFKELFSQFMKYSPVYTFIKEVSETESRVLQASDNYQEMIGIAKPEMIGKTMEELFPPEFAANITADDWDTVNKGKVLEKDEEFDNKYYTTIKFPLRVGNKKLLAGYTIDITERKNAEKEVLRSRELLNQTGRIAKTGGWELDLTTMQPFLSDETYRIFGLEPTHPPNYEEVIGYYSPESRPIIEEAIKNAITKNIPYDLELPFNNARGKNIWVRSQGRALIENEKTVKLNGTIQDITERKQAEAAILKAKENAEVREEFFTTVLNNMGDPVFVKDNQSRLILVNDAFCDLFNLKREDIIGRTLAEDISEEEMEQFLKNDKQVLLDGKENINEETISIRDKQSRAISTRKTRFIDEQGNKFLVGISRDFTKRKEAEEALRESEIRFKALHNASFGGITIHDKGLILDCNQGLSEITGYSINELIGMDGMKLISEESRELVMGNILAGYEKPYEAIGVKKSGEKYPIRLEAKMIPYKGQKVRVVEFRDITEQKRSEESLLDLSSRYEALLDAIPDIIMEVDVNKVYTWANKEGIDFFGDDVIGKEASCFFEGEQNTYNTVAPLFKGSKDIIYVESWQRRKDGEKRLLAWQCRMIKDRDGNVTGTLSSALDITNRKKVELELKRSEQKFRALFEQAGGYSMILDPNTPDGIPVIVDANEAAYKIHGYTKDEFIGRPVSDIDNEEGKLLVKQKTAEIMTGKPFYTENVHVRKDGSTFVVAVNAKRIDIGNEPPLIFSLEYDITDRVEAEKELLESEERFNLAMAATKDGLYDWNLVTNEIYYSPGWKNMLGYKNHELPNDFSVWEKLTEPESVKKSWEMQQQLINKQRDRFEIEFKMRHKNGTWVDIFSRAEAIFDENGKAIRIVGTHLDITELKKVEKTIYKLNKELEQKVIDRTKKLEDQNKQLVRMNKLFVGRELRMIELKDRIKELEKKSLTK